MAFIIRLCGPANGPMVQGDHFVVAYDPDFLTWALPLPGGGSVEVTTDPAKAQKFGNMVEALNCWRRASTVVPTRPDGRPNRPLTALHAEIERTVE